MYSPYSNHSYASLSFGNGNLFYYLCTSNICCVSSGVAILVVGVIITSVTFLNLQSWNEARKEGFAGPILIAAGLLLMGRGVVSRVGDGQCNASVRHCWNAICRTSVRLV